MNGVEKSIVSDLSSIVKLCKIIVMDKVIMENSRLLIYYLAYVVINMYSTYKLILEAQNVLVNAVYSSEVLHN